jgi:ABC-type Na+ efflux pump permease subunit
MRRRDFGALLAAVAMLIAGLLAVSQGSAGWYDTVEITRTQAHLFGWASIAFSIVLFFIYFRGSKQH